MGTKLEMEGFGLSEDETKIETYHYRKSAKRSLPSHGWFE